MSKKQVFWVSLFLGLIFFLWLLKDSLLPFILAACLAYILDPLVDRLELYRVSRTWATIMVMVLGLGAIILIVLLILPLFQTQILLMGERIPYYTQVIQEQGMPFFDQVLLYLNIDNVASLRETITDYFGSIMSWIGSVLSGLISGGFVVFDILMILIITPFVTFYLLRDWNRLTEGIDSFLPQDVAPVIREQFQEIHKTLMQFIFGQFLICVTLAVFYSGCLLWIGLDFALLIGVMSGVISFVPYIGTLFGFIVGIGFAYLQFGTVEIVLLTAAVFIFGNFVEGYILQPKLVGSSVGLHPVSVIFALVAGGTLLGFIGILLAVPVTAMIGVLVRFGLKRYLLSDFFISHRK